MDSLACSTLVYRALARRKWIDPVSQSVLPAAFLRRPPPQDDDGLSVNFESAASCAKTLRECFGVVSLHVGRLRDLGIDVRVDDAPHALIIGLPRTSDDPGRAEWLASQLAKQSRLVTTST